MERDVYQPSFFSNQIGVLTEEVAQVCLFFSVSRLDTIHGLDRGYNFGLMLFVYQGVVCSRQNL